MKIRRKFRIPLTRRSSWKCVVPPFKKKFSSSSFFLSSVVSHPFHVSRRILASWVDEGTILFHFYFVSGHVARVARVAQLNCMQLRQLLVTEIRLVWRGVFFVFVFLNSYPSFFPPLSLTPQLQQFFPQWTSLMNLSIALRAQSKFYQQYVELSS